MIGYIFMMLSHSINTLYPDIEEGKDANYEFYYGIDARIDILEGISEKYAVKL